MSKSVFVVPCQNPAYTDGQIRQILQRHKYKETQVNGQKAWCLGGFWAARKWVQFEYRPGQLVIYGWINSFSYWGESDLKGVVGVLPKQQLLSMIEQIKKVVV